MLWIHVLFLDSKMSIRSSISLKRIYCASKSQCTPSLNFRRLLKTTLCSTLSFPPLHHWRVEKNEIWVKLNVHVVIDSVLFRSFLHSDILSSYYCFGIHCRLSATIRLRRGITGKLFGTYTRNQRNNNILNVRSQARLKVTEMGIWHHRKIATEVHQAPICPH